MLMLKPMHLLMLRLRHSLMRIQMLMCLQILKPKHSLTLKLMH
ncbi:hypothetical protein CGSSpSV36_2186 [Streptococcus pneumoniae SV36]|nr:hypothetical protein CGSSpSV36_2186 [Streptococcus pneumoniae SV36]